MAFLFFNGYAAKCGQMSGAYGSMADGFVMKMKKLWFELSDFGLLISKQTEV